MLVSLTLRNMTYLLSSCKCKKNQLIEQFECYCNVLADLGLNSAKYDLNIIKSYILPILFNELDTEPTVIKNTNQFVSFKLGDIQLLDIMIFLGSATNLDSLLKAYKTNETNGCFPYDWFDCTEKLSNSEHPPYDSFFDISGNSNPLEKDNNDFENLVQSRSSIEQTLAKLRMHNVPSTGAEIYT